jgi:hypothetical protein
MARRLDSRSARGARVVSSRATMTVGRNGHVAAAAYPMRQPGATALAVLEGDRSSPPMGIITDD